jgi:hypothetical protein
MAWSAGHGMGGYSRVQTVQVLVFGNLALELGSIEIVFGKFLYT